jgi:uncharacterized protein
MIVEIGGNNFRLLPEKAILWIEEKTLLISDLHLGKTSFFRLKGIPAPEGGDEGDLNKLKQLILTTGAENLIILGDLFHSKSPINSEVTTFFLESVKGINLKVIKGNHDRIKAEEFNALREKVLATFETGNFIFSHTHFIDDEKFVFAGHIHPSVYLRGKGRTGERVPCFHLTPYYAVLPSFGSFTGSYLISPQKHDRIFIPVEDKVIEIKQND